MKIAIFGSGYVGLVTGACFADFGNDVTLVDVDAAKVEWLKVGQIPIYEPGLEEMVTRNYEAGRIHFTIDARQGLDGAEAVFVAVGTPEGEDGMADLSFVEAVAKTVGDYVRSNPKVKAPIVVLKSTVPVGTADRCRAILPKEVEVVNNPEFLKEGTAINDFLRPERVVVGTEDERARELMRELYLPFVRTGAPILCMSNRSAEVSKYAANCFLAMKVSFINDLALFCEKAGADVYDVRGAMIKDSRIGSQFLHPGAGYGGSCFPKDVQALVATARKLETSLPLIQATHEINERQKHVMPTRVIEFLRAAGKTKARVALWGVSFKPETDDIRESAALTLIDEVCGQGHHVCAYDPKGIEPLLRQRKGLIDAGLLSTHVKPRDAIQGADILAVMTEWNEFRNPDFTVVASQLKLKAIFDGKNIYRSATLERYGLKHFGIGMKAFRA